MSPTPYTTQHKSAFLFIFSELRVCILKLKSIDYGLGKSVPDVYVWHVPIGPILGFVDLEKVLRHNKSVKSGLLPMLNDSRRLNTLP